MKCEQPSCRTDGSVAGGDEPHPRMNTWWVRSSVCLSADQFAGNLLESSGAAVKRLRLEGRNGILMWKWTLEYLDRLWNHVETKGTRAFWSEIGRTLGCPACETPGPGKSHTHTRECKTYQDARDESRRTAAAEANREVAADPDTRPLNPSSSSTDPEPKMTTTTAEEDAENSTERMDVITFKGHLQHLIRLNLSVMKTCRRRREWRETFLTSVVRAN